MRNNPHPCERCGRRARSARSSRPASRAAWLRAIFRCAARAAAPVVVHAVGQVAVLLRLKQNRARPDGVHCPGIDINHFAARHRQRVQLGLRAFPPGCLFDFGKRRAGLTPSATSAPGSAASTYQHSVLPRGWPYFLRHPSSGCTCTLSFSRAKMVLISSGESAPRACPPSSASCASATDPPAACPRAGRFGEAVVARQPNLADRLALRHAVIPRPQIAESPPAAPKFRPRCQTALLLFRKHP